MPNFTVAPYDYGFAAGRRGAQRRWLAGADLTPCPPPDRTEDEYDQGYRAGWDTVVAEQSPAPQQEKQL